MPKAEMDMLFEIYERGEEAHYRFVVGEDADGLGLQISYEEMDGGVFRERAVITAIAPETAKKMAVALTQVAAYFEAKQAE